MPGLAAFSACSASDRTWFNNRVRLCCTNKVKAKFGFLPAELWHRDRYGRAKTRKAIQHGGTDLHRRSVLVRSGFSALNLSELSLLR